MPRNLYFTLTFLLFLFTLQVFSKKCPHPHHDDDDNDEDHINRCFLPSTVEEREIAKYASKYIFDVLGSTTANYFGDTPTIEKYLRSNFSLLLSPNAIFKVSFPPVGNPPYISSPPGKEGFIQAWKDITKGESIEIYRFTDLDAEDLLSYQHLSVERCPRSSFIRVKGKNDGLVYFKNPETQENTCIHYLVQLYWDVEVKSVRKELEPRIHFIYEYIQMAIPQVICPPLEDIQPSVLLPPVPSFMMRK